MKEYTLLSWNANGLRSLYKKKVSNEKKFLEWLKDYSPDVLCLQETKATEDQLPKELTDNEEFISYWNSAERKGYSGVGTLVKREPKKIQYGLKNERFNKEGRIIRTDFPEFILFNVYFPNGKQSRKRLRYKMDYYDEFLNIIDSLVENGQSVVFFGDVNTAHKEIDLANPKANEDVSGFLPVERQWIDKVIDHGFIDTYRHFYPDKEEQYSYWSYRSRARERNVGWRLDYFFVSKDLKENIQDAIILSNVYGSDHCPVGLTLEF
jgi:exodeoxyribonuclease-3